MPSSKVRDTQQKKKKRILKIATKIKQKKLIGILQII